MQVTQSLAVRYRPRRLDSVIGQKEALSTIKGIFKAKNIGPAFLISGPSGTGKTTLARIVAHYINCQNFDHDKVSPCWSCDYCNKVKEGTYEEVNEVNFADSRGIDSVREIIEDMRYETSANAKVYILDEMHMMTKQAANALLKPLEEPPSNVLILLLTTEPQLVERPLKNRCLQLSLKSVPSADIYGFLERVLEKEKRSLPAPVLKYVAELVHGDVRLSLSKLESLFFALDSQKDLDLANMETLYSVLGTNLEDDVATVADFLAAIYSARYALAFEKARNILNNRNVNVRQFVDRAMEYHEHALMKMLGNSDSSDFYKDWSYTFDHYEREQWFRLGVPGAVQVFQLFVELAEKLREYTWNERNALLYYTNKMVDAVRITYTVPKVKSETP